MECPFWRWKHGQHWPDGGSDYLVGQIEGDTVGPFGPHSYHSGARRTPFQDRRYCAHEFDDAGKVWIIGCEYAARQFELFALPTMGTIMSSVKQEVFCTPSVGLPSLWVGSH
jgi:hypothetical protein